MPIISHATQQVTSSNERSIYNRRPKALFVHTDMLCKHLIEWCLIVDNMPLDVCKFNRSFSKKTYYSSFRQRLLNIAASLLLRIYYMPFAHWIRSFVTLTYRKLWFCQCNGCTNRYFKFIVFHILQHLIKKSEFPTIRINLQPTDGFYHLTVYRIRQKVHFGFDF